MTHPKQPAEAERMLSEVASYHSGHRTNDRVVVRKRNDSASKVLSGFIRKADVKLRR